MSRTRLNVAYFKTPAPCLGELRTLYDPAWQEHNSACRVPFSSLPHLKPPSPLSMLQSITFVTLFLILSAQAQSPTYSATYLPSDAPYQSEQGQSGYNNCTTGYNQTSECQNAYGACHRWLLCILVLTRCFASQHYSGLVCLGAS
jgi:hypothetical protein